MIHSPKPNICLRWAPLPGRFVTHYKSLCSSTQYLSVPGQHTPLYTHSQLWPHRHECKVIWLIWYDYMIWLIVIVFALIVTGGFPYPSWTACNYFLPALSFLILQSVSLRLLCLFWTLLCHLEFFHDGFRSIPMKIVITHLQICLSLMLTTLFVTYNTNYVFR